MVNDLYTQISQCRVCGATELKEVVSLGDHAITTFGSATEEPQRAPLDVVYCENCSVAQLRHTVRPEILYRSYYWFRSGMNKTMREHLHGLARTLEARARAVPGDIVVDIGCNDGTMFDGFTRPGILKVGYEPGEELAAEARDRGAMVFNSFFSAEAYTQVFRKAAKALSAIAMFYDLEKPKAFVAGLRSIMDANSVAVIEMNDLYSMVKNRSFDFIGHEHLVFYTLRGLIRVFAEGGLDVYDAERHDWLGGSLRVWACVQGARKREPGVERELDQEQSLDYEELSRFGTSILGAVVALRQWVEEEVGRGGRVYIYGASTRGNTILQTAELDHKLIAGAAEIHPDKIGKVLVGTGIPIVGEEEARRDATAFLVLPYAYRSEFLSREAEFLANGGKIAFPLPQLEVIGG